MYRRKFENNAVHPLRRSNRSTVKATVNEGVQLAPFLYSNEIRLFTEGPIQVCSYHYSLRKASKKSYICEIFFYPKVVIKKHICRHSFSCEEQSKAIYNLQRHDVSCTKMPRPLALEKSCNRASNRRSIQNKDAASTEETITGIHFVGAFGTEDCRHCSVDFSLNSPQR